MRGYAILALCAAFIGTAAAQTSNETDDDLWPLEEEADLEDTAPTGSVSRPSSTIEGSNGVSIPVFAVDPDGNGIIDDAEDEAARRFTATSGECDGTIATTESPEAITAMDETAPVSLMLACADPDGLGPGLRAAIAANSGLMDTLDNSGVGLSNVAGIELDEMGGATLYLADN